MSISKKAKANYAEANRIAQTLEPNFHTAKWQKINDIDFDIACNFVKYMWDKKSDYKMPKRIKFKKTTGHRYTDFKPSSTRYKNINGFHKITAGTYCINITNGWGNFAHEFSHDLAWIINNHGEHGDFQSGVELEVHKELHTFLHKAKNNLIDIIPLPVDEPKKRKRRKKRKTKKLPYEASYPTLLKRFPQITAEMDFTREDGTGVYWIYIDDDFYKEHGLSQKTDDPLDDDHYATGSYNRDDKVKICAEFIYKLTNKNN